MFSDTLSWFNFWGWQAIIVSAAITLPLGLTTSKEYAELEWPIDIAIAVVWVAFTVNLLGTILKRREKHMYVAIWFYIATAITVAVLHIVNSMEMPAGWFKSYSMYAGVQDALVQWWYGHNAVAFFLTTPYLGLMYYFLPKAANRPMFSYRLSIIHFWALIFIYIWAGPHHLLYTALPDWAQSLGMVFSVMLVAPSWGGMLNGLLTLRGAWDKVRQDPMLKFMVVAVTAYGMATLEGPTLAIKSVNSLSHYTDWTIAHVHTGALGWNGFLTFSMLYWLFPRLYNTKLWSTKLANYHFWIGLLGMMFYVVPMYASGVTQGLMWKQFNTDGFLQYPNFLETSFRIIPMYRLRAIGGIALHHRRRADGLQPLPHRQSGQFVPETRKPRPRRSERGRTCHESPRLGHRWLEASRVTFTVLAFVAVLIGGLVEIIPMFLIKAKRADHRQREALHAAGSAGPRHLHPRRLRRLPFANDPAVPFRNRALRRILQGRASSSMTIRSSGVRSAPGRICIASAANIPTPGITTTWTNPRSTSPGSIMPRYPWLLTQKLDTGVVGAACARCAKSACLIPRATKYKAQKEH